MKPCSEPNQCEQCDQLCVHRQIVDAVKPRIPQDEVLYDVAELFKVFGDSTRIKILYVLFESEMCVCDIADLLGMTQSAISHQLKYRRDGKTVYYSLADDHIVTIFNQGLEHVQE